MGAGLSYRLGLAWLAALMLMVSLAVPAYAASIEDLLQAESEKVEALIAKGSFKAAVAPARTLVAKARRLLRKDDPRVVVYAAELADIIDRAGDPRRAQVVARAVSKIVANGVKDSPELSAGLATLARLLANAGNYDEAEKLLTRALALAEDTTGPGSAEVTGLQRQLADIYERHGRKAEAELLRQSLAAAAAATSAELSIQRSANTSAAAKEDQKTLSVDEGGTGASKDEQAAQPAPSTEPEIALPAPPPVTAPPEPSDGAVAGKPAPAPAAKASPAPEVFTPQSKKRTAARRAPSSAAPPAEPAPAPATAASAQAQYHVVPVFYGTNRKPTEGVASVAFSSSESEATTLGMAMVTVPLIHQVPQVERPWALRVPGTDIEITFEAQDPAKHFTIKSIENLPQDQFIARAKAQVAGSQTYKGQALVFVHGFYNKFDDALYRTAQIAYDMQFDGGTFMYSWPSAGTIDAYWSDRPKAKNSGAKLRAFLTLVATRTGATRISVIAHSMGNLPLLEALDETIAFDQPSPSASIDEVVLAAPDIGRKDFTDLVSHMSHVRGGITLYAASNDLALEASRTLNREPRAGDIGTGGPLLLPHVDTIDATRASTQMFRLNHYYVAESSAIMCDVEHLMRGGVRPPNTRSKILATVKADTGTYYAYRP